MFRGFVSYCVYSFTRIIYDTSLKFTDFIVESEDNSDFSCLNMKEDCYWLIVRRVLSNSSDFRFRNCATLKLYEQERERDSEREEKEWEREREKMKFDFIRCRSFSCNSCAKLPRVSLKVHFQQCFIRFLW